MPAKLRLSTDVCPLCGNSESNRTLFELSRFIVECGACGLVFAAPLANDERQADYDETYYRSGIYADYLEDRAAIRKNAVRTLSELEKLVSGRSLLDVGCAAGFFLEAARDRGWSVRGLDISSYASEYARAELRLDVEAGSIESERDATDSFDVVTLWDTIEHLRRPDLALINIRRLLKPGGMLALSTGDYGCLLRRLMGRRWRLFTDPTHNFFFDEASLKRLLRQAGFETVRITRRGKWVSLSMILHQSPFPLNRLGRVWMGSGKPLLNPALYINLYDVMTVFARVAGEN